MISCSKSDLLAMLVHTGEEKDVVAGSTSKTSLDIAKQSAVRSSQVWLCVDVINWGGNKV